MRELKTGLQTSGCYTRRYPPCGQDISIDKVIKGPSLRDARYVNKLFNLLSLTECGFYGHLEEDRLFYLNMDEYCRPRRYSPLTFSKLSRLQNETDKKQERSFCFAPMNMCLKRCLLSCMVGLVQLPDSTRVICFQGYEPSGCQG